MGIFTPDPVKWISFQETAAKDEVRFEMGIVKYGKAAIYGYGVCLESCYRRSFYTSLKIVAKSKTTTVTESEISGFERVIEGIKDGTSVIPLYLVMDDADMIWREYFSGLTIDYLGTGPSSFFEYDVDNTGRNDSLKANNIITKNITVARVDVINVTQFATEVSAYNDRQIRRFVEKLYQMQYEAKQWRAKLEELEQKVSQERKEKEYAATSIEARIAAGFGRYAFGNAAGNAPKEPQRAQPTYTIQDTSYRPYKVQNVPERKPLANKILSDIENRQFHRVQRGYEVKAVDAFIQMIYDQYNGSSNRRITVEIISTEEFTFAKNGYDPREVDEFLDHLCDLIEGQ